MTPGNVPSEHGPLSANTAARREAILRDLHRVMDARRRGRRILAGATALAVLLGAGAVTWSAWPLEVKPHQQPAGTNSDAMVAATARPATLKVTIVPTDATALARLGVPTDGRVRFSTISDDELVALASASGKGQGLMRLGDKAVLLSGQPGSEADPDDGEDSAPPTGQ